MKTVVTYLLVASFCNQFIENNCCLALRRAIKRFLGLYIPQMDCVTIVDLAQICI